MPLTISTDPRNHFQAVLGASTRGSGFTLWPEPLGFAALGNPGVVRRIGDVARREYRAVGIHMALSPQADLASEPRWPRGTATFGSDPAKVSALVVAYVQGFQHGTAGVSKDRVATVVKHWVGYGAEPRGFDAHNHYGRTVRLDNASFAQHVAAFDGAFAAGVAGVAGVSGVMPTYPIIAGVTLGGRPLEQVGAGFNRQLLTGLLRGRKKFAGLIMSNWGTTNDCPIACSTPTRERPQTPAAIAMSWGVEAMDRVDRFVKAVDAGMDQFGGVDDPAPLIAAAEAGKVSVAPRSVRQARTDAEVRAGAVRRSLRGRVGRCG
ncbi:glycoside hydrolase family 3 N-terminal domain-containing protein [Sphingomonas sp. CLY1604]|uniref:glycoside hydrolase family 3 N-terminal domain-containing protein n=1 Tax=Sphingomonas sp. CLY1604 TaxID=3457786 RepID=UPI003FD8BA4B